MLACRSFRTHLLSSPLRSRRITFIRRYATRSHERVQIRCGSGGYTSIDLFNVSDSQEQSLLIHLPPCPSLDDEPQLPEVLQDRPVVSINYRWDESTPDAAGGRSPGQWPIPVHDTAFAYSWILQNLAPTTGRRDILVHGSYLGASLAMSLALTESHGHAPFGIRGVVTYNGVYNWTMFLPKHPIHRKRGKVQDLLDSPVFAEGQQLEQLYEWMPDLFKDPSNLFDAFASPSLFFHSPGLDVPRSFFPESLAMSTLADKLTGLEIDGSPNPPKPPRKSHMVFPPRASTLRIPETLLMYDRAPPRSGKGRTKQLGNTFSTQADELAELMRRSVEKVELKERSRWDDEMDDVWDDEPFRRVQLAVIDEGTADFSMGKEAQAQLLTWLEDKE